MANRGRQWNPLLPPVQSIGAFLRCGNNPAFRGLTEPRIPAGSPPGTPPPGTPSP